MFWNCLTMFSLKRWGKSAETSIEIVLEYFCWGDEQIRLKQVLKLWQYFRWSDEEIRLRRVLKLPHNVFVEAMRGFGWHKYLNCLRIFSLKWWGISVSNKFWNCLTMFSFKWWRNPVRTCFQFVLQCFRWTDEGIQLRRVLRLSQIIFVVLMRKFGWNNFWNCLTIFLLKWWRIPVKTCFGIVLQCFRWSDEGSRLRQVLRLS